MVCTGLYKYATGNDNNDNNDNFVRLFIYSFCDRYGCHEYKTKISLDDKKLQIRECQATF